MSINSKPRGGSNGTGGGKIFQNLNPGNLSRVLERRLVEFSGFEEDESDCESQNGDSDYTADDGSPMFASVASRNASSPSTPISSQFLNLNDSNHPASIMRRNAPTFEQRHDNGSIRKHVQYTEF
jgi:hypothetical protein